LRQENFGRHFLPVRGFHDQPGSVGIWKGWIERSSKKQTFLNCFHPFYSVLNLLLVMFYCKSRAVRGPTQTRFWDSSPYLSLICCPPHYNLNLIGAAGPSVQVIAEAKHRSRRREQSHCLWRCQMTCRPWSAGSDGVCR
jgi:hypothetical protein